MSLLLELREAARNCTSTKSKNELKIAADALAVAIDQFYKDRDIGTMTALNGAWARAMRVKQMAPGPFSPAGGSSQALTQRRAA